MTTVQGNADNRDRPVRSDEADIELALVDLLEALCDQQILARTAGTDNTCAACPDEKKQRALRGRVGIGYFA